MGSWVWIVAGVVVIVGVLIGFAVRASRRDRAAAKADGPGRAPWPLPHEDDDEEPAGGVRRTYGSPGSGVQRGPGMRDPRGDRGERARRDDDERRRRDEDGGTDAMTYGALGIDAADGVYGQAGSGEPDRRTWFEPAVESSRDHGRDPYPSSDSGPTYSAPSYSDPGPSSPLSAPDPGPSSSSSSFDSGSSGGGGSDGGGGGGM